MSGGAGKVSEKSAAPVAIIGAGPIAIAYFEALQSLGVPAVIFGRGQMSADIFKKKTGAPVGVGPLGEQLDSLGDLPTKAIVAVNVDQLAGVTRELLARGVASILLEKPGGVDVEQVVELAEQPGARGVLIAYNRRFLPSTMTARDIVADDGGATSFLFEFNENIPLVRTLDQHGDHIRRNWLYANSTHVIDMAFHLVGYAGPLPDTMELSARTRGDHTAAPPALSYAGCGTIEDIVFAYHADWRSAGRWGVEICTPKRRLILKPLETLQEMLSGSFAMAPIPLAYSEDEGLKPGFQNMVRAFLSPQARNLFATLPDQARRLTRFSALLGSPT